ncbi:sulfatase [Parasphingopyxis algicola]|uniref:sulfatase family protein n=1 Tax=Parasphingopyxis algicola TaxID=2026624 RepID=UPI0015A06846|nr:sulfatase [Parasphingopyxis algicola]QLC24740.1 sulfatase [Parasphingopyxis algicola]
MRGLPAVRDMLRSIATLLLLLPASAAWAHSDERPNMILILTDDQRFDAIGALTPGLETPAMDRLLREGLHFRNAFVTTSLCSPSRASLITGMAMRNHGVVDNNSATPQNFRPFSVQLDEAGYDTAFIGKWHMGHADASPKPGFDRWVSFEGQGNYGPVDAFGSPSLLNVDGEEVPQRGYITDELTDYALDWLGGRDETPFFLYLSHKAAHLPFTPAERHRGQYADTDFARPPSWSTDARSGPVPMWLSNQRNSWSGVDFTYYSHSPLIAFQRDYYASLSAVDDSLARILAWIEANPNGRDTVVIFTSDNGFMFGEQGLIDKRAAYEASIRVPMIVHAPARFGAGRTVDAIARNIDVAPTILDLAGLAVPDHYDGRSLLAAATGDAGDEQPALVYEYFWEFNYPQTPSTFALRTDRYKYIQYHGVWDTEELFDLHNDPDELVNLIGDPDHAELVRAMRARLHQTLSRGEARPAIPFTARFNQGAVFWSPDAASSVNFPPHWRRTPDAPDRYEHILPDGPEKERQLQAITPAVGRILSPGADDREETEGE